MKGKGRRGLLEISPLTQLLKFVKPSYNNTPS
jgi:hypothetical protein